METIKYTLPVEEDEDQLDGISLETDVTVHGWFTTDIDGTYCEDKKYFKYFYMPNSKNVRFDLNKSHKDDIYKEGSAGGYIESILKWITLHSLDEKGNPKLPDADFICSRGLLCNLMYIPYERNENLMLCAVRLRNTIYLCQFQTEENHEQRKKLETEEMAKLTRYGFKFEQYMVSDVPNQAPDTDKPLSAMEEMDFMFKGKIGSHKMMYCAEIDGLLPDEAALSDLSSAKFVELKTCKKNISQHSFKRFKLLKWWIQSWLVNINKLVVGYRDDTAGVVNKLEEMSVHDMPYLCKQYWKAEKCIKFLQDFLSFVKFVMRDSPQDNPEAVYMFEWSPNNDFEAIRLPVDHEYYFIPDWYTEWINEII